jgi:ABC-type sugar transport system permease subunit
VLRQYHFEILRIVMGDNALVIGARDPLFWQSLFTTFRYCVFLLLFSIPPALGLAMLLNARIPGMKFFRAVYFLPSIAAVVGVALIWQWLYNPVIGYINYAMTNLVNALNPLFGGTLVDPEIAWLTDDNIMLFSAVIMAAWQVIGFNAVILLAGLQGVPKELLEAATVDGANGWTRFRKVILPLIAPTTFFVTVTTLISGLQAFTEMFVLFGNSTSNARLTTVFYLYQQGFQRFQMGYASATAWALFAVIFVITLIQFRMSQSNRAYAN